MSTAPPQDVPPLVFHPKTHQNMWVSSDGRHAQRQNTSFFTRGIVFGSRPLKIGEKVCFKLVGSAQDLGSFMYIGLVTRDPEILGTYTIQRLAQMQGYKSWFFPKELCELNQSLFFYLTQEGVVRYGVGESEKGRFEGVVKMDVPHWPLIDIFGNSQAIRLVEPIRRTVITNKKRTPLMIHPLVHEGVAIHGNTAQLNENSLTGIFFSKRPIEKGEELLITLGEGLNRSGLIQVGVVNEDPTLLTPQDYHPLGQLPSPYPGAQLSYTPTPLPFPRPFLRVLLAGVALPVRIFSLQEVVSRKREGRRCAVCFEGEIEAALYRCGHTCLCFECAVEQWRGKGGGRCPVCRAQIRDVVRICR